MSANRGINESGLAIRSDSILLVNVSEDVEFWMYSFFDSV